MANKKINELSVRVPVITDLIGVGDPTTGYLYKSTLQQLQDLIEANIALTDLTDVTISAPSSGQVLRYDGTVWVNATETFVGTVTSVAMSVPTGLTISGTPITTSGTLALTLTSGYSIPTNASQTNWDTAYTNRITSLTTTGTSGASTLVSNVLNVPNYTLSGLGGQPQLNGTGFVKISGTTISYDNSTYLTTISGIAAGGDLSGTYANPTVLNSAVIGKVLTGYTSGAGTVAATDTILQAFQKLNGNIGALTTGVSSVFGRTGAVVATEGDYTLTQLGDVTITTPSSGQVLKYNGSEWVNNSDTDTGITTLNTLTALTQTFAVGTSGTDFGISSATSTHTFNLPTASATNRGALSSADWSTFNNKQATISLTTTGTSGAATFIANTLNIPNYGSALSGYLPLTGGTLTGALTGTSATFSTASGNQILLVEATTGTNASYMAFKNTGQRMFVGIDNSTGTQIIGSGNPYQGVISMEGARDLVLATSGITRLTIASTGAATFSSTITAATLSTFGTAVGAQNVQLNLNGVSGKAQRIEFQNSGVQQWLIGAGAASETSAFEIFNSNGTIVYSVNKTTNAATFTGAATFSSSIASSGTFTLNPASGSSSFYINQGTSGGAAYISWFNSSAARLGYLGYSNTNIALTLENSANFTVNGGNVLIGTTTAHYATTNRTVLNVNGTSSAIIGLQAANTTSGYLYVDANDFTISTEGTRNLNLTTAGAAPMVFQTNGSEKMRITSGGNVGIGTTAPSGRLSVIGGGVASGLVTYAGNTVDDGVILGYVPSTGLAEIIGINEAFSTYNDLGIRVGNATQLYLKTNGNVGIGTTGPTSKLQVAGASSDPSLTHGVAGVASFTPAIGTELVIGGGTATPNAIWLQTRHIALDGYNYPLSLNPLGGNVGIGTTAPGAKLVISSGATAVAPTLGATTGISSIISYDNSWGTVFGMNSINGNGWIQQQRIDGTGTAYNLLLQPVGGNVGIGTTSPARTLDVVGQLRTFGSAASGSGEVFIGNPAISNGQGLLYFVPSNTVKNWQVATNNFVAGDFSITPSTATGGSTFTTPALLITSSSNVLIGTTTDAGYKLDVNGTGRFSGNVSITDTASFGGQAKLFSRITADATTVGKITDSGLHIWNTTTVGSLSQITFGYTNGSTTNASVYLGLITTNGTGSGFGDFVLGTAPSANVQCVERLRIASTGAATFSSTIAAGNSTFANGSGLSQTTIGQTSIGYAGLRLAVDATFYSWIIGAQYNVSNAFEITPSTAVGGSTFTTPVFSILNTGGATFSSSVTAGGLVTINKQNEGLILTSGANTDASYMSTRANNSTGWMIMGSQGTTAGYIQTGTGANESVITTVGAYALSLGTNQVERMRISSNGNVGIGEVSPQYKLDIFGNCHVQTQMNVGTYDGGSVYPIQTGYALSLGEGATASGKSLICDGAIAIGNTVSAAVAVASTHKVQISIGGTTYYLLSTNV